MYRKLKIVAVIIVFISLCGFTTIDEYIEGGLDNINFYDFGGLLSDNEMLKSFEANDFLMLVRQAVAGEINLSFEEFTGKFFSLFFSSFTAYMPLLLMLASLAIISSIFSTISTEQSSVKKAVFFGTFLCVLSVLLVAVMSLFRSVLTAINSIKLFSELTFPIILTMMTASGGVMSSKIYKPLSSILIYNITNIISTIVMPLFIAIYIFSMLDCFSSNIRLRGLVEGLTSLIKWILGLVFTVFMAFLVIKGITSSIYDGISVRAAKYTISNSVPIVGGVIKDGFDLVIGSCVLIKNAVGVGGMLIIILLALSPLISLLSFYFGLKILQAVIEPICDEKIYSFFKQTTKCLNLLMVILIATTFLYFLTMMLFVLTGNATLT